MDHSTKITLLRGGTVALGVLAGTSANAELLVQNPNATVTTPDTLYFDVDQSSLSTSDTSLEAYLETQNGPDPTGKLGQQTGDIEFTGTLDPGSTVDGNSTFALTNKLTNGTNDYGFRLGADPTPNFGYVEITQVETIPSGSTDPIPTDAVYTDTLNTIVYQKTAGVGVTTAPEPGTTSLLLSAVAGAAGLAAWRRRSPQQA